MFIILQQSSFGIKGNWGHSQTEGIMGETDHTFPPHGQKTRCYVCDHGQWNLAQSLRMVCISSPPSKARLLEKIFCSNFLFMFCHACFYWPREPAARDSRKTLSQGGGLFTPSGQGCFTKLAAAWKDSCCTVLLFPDFVTLEIISKGSFFVSKRSFSGDLLGLEVSWVSSPDNSQKLGISNEIRTNNKNERRVGRRRNETVKMVFIWSSQWKIWSLKNSTDTGRDWRCSSHLKLKRATVRICRDDNSKSILSRIFWCRYGQDNRKMF